MNLIQKIRGLHCRDRALIACAFRDVTLAVSGKIGGKYAGVRHAARIPALQADLGLPAK